MNKNKIFTFTFYSIFAYIYIRTTALALRSEKGDARYAAVGWSDTGKGTILSLFYKGVECYLVVLSFWLVHMLMRYFDDEDGWLTG